MWAAIAACLILSAGCVQLDPVAVEGPPSGYVLGASSPQGGGGVGQILAVQLMAFPEYALRRQLALRSEDVRITYLAGSRWMEEPQEGWLRALGEALAAGEPAARLLRWGSFPQTDSTPVLQLWVERFEGLDTGQAILSVTAGWLRNGRYEALPPVQLSTPWQVGDAASLVRAHNANIRELAALMAQWEQSVSETPE
jgi:uncharacterized lipoprotein YmbA